METKTFFSKVDKIKENLIFDINLIHDSEKEIVNLSEKALLKIDKALREVKSLVSDFVFENMAEEVYFFKNIKPYFISQYIYYSTILNIEAPKPKSNTKTLKRYYEKELLKLKNYTLEHQHFYDYYSRNATYLDYKYFVRRSYDLKMALPQNLYNYDDDFATSHDQYISCFLANENIGIYLSEAIHKLNSTPGDLKRNNLQWSISKVALTELLYALYRARCFNGGNVELSQIMRWAEHNFNTDLGNYHKTIAEIRGRKTGRTKFMRFLSENLDQYFYDLDA